MKSVLALGCCSLLLWTAVTVSAEVAQERRQVREYMQVCSSVFRDDAWYCVDSVQDRVAAEKRWARADLQGCMEAYLPRATTRWDDARECFDKVQRRLDNAAMWPMCRTLVGRLSSFEVCVDREQVLVP